MKRAPLVATLLFAASPALATRVTVGTGSAAPGGTAAVAVSLASEGQPVSTFQVDVKFSAPVVDVAATISNAASVAGKQVSLTTISGGMRVLVFGSTATAVPDGSVVTLSFFLNGSAATGTYPLTASNALGADLNGLPVTVTPVSGSLTVGSSAAATFLLPSSAHVPGANGAVWTTDLAVANTGTTDATLTLKFLSHDADGRSGPQVQLAVPAGRTTVVTDVLSLFNVTNGWGAIQISSTVATLAVSGQTSTAGAACVGGSFGQSVPAVGSSGLVVTGAPRSLVGVREDETSHTNLVLANAGQAGCDVSVSLVSGAGTTLGSKVVTLQPLGMTQLTNVARGLGVTGNVAGARLVVVPVTQSASVAAYASVIDNATNDPRTLLPQ